MLAFGEDINGNAVVAAYNASTLASLLAPVPYGVENFFGAVDLRDGRVVVAGFDINYDIALFVLDLRTLPAVPSPPVQFGCAGSYAGACPPGFNTAADGLVPLAAAGDGAGSIDVAASLDDGNAAIASLSTGTFETLVDTFSPNLIESIVAAASTPIFVATKPGDDLAVAFGSNGALRWFVDAASPTVAASVSLPGLGVLPTIDYAFVAGDGDNNVLVVDIATGQRVARVNFDVAPGGDGYADAAAWVPSAAGLEGDLIFPSTAFPGLLRFPTGTDAPSAISRTPAIGFVAAASDARNAWAVTGGATPLVEGFLDGAWDAPLPVLLASGAQPRRVAARGRLLAVAHDEGLSLIDADAAPTPPATAGVTAIPSAGAPAFYGLGFTPGGDVWAVVERDDDVTVGFWTPASLVAGGTPRASWIVPGTTSASRTASVRTAALLEDGLWVFWSDVDAQESFATLFDATLGEGRTVPASDQLLEIHAISPNGRLLVHRETGGSLGFAVRFFRADPEAGFPEVGSLIFNERVEGFTFDSSGERLYVITQSPDRIVTID